MHKRRLESQIRSVGIAYVLMFIAGAHYAYMGRWGTQVLFWLTLGGLGIWWFIDIFRLPGMIYRFNDPIFDELEWIEEQELRREDDFLELQRMKAERSINSMNNDHYRF